MFKKFFILIRKSDWLLSVTAFFLVAFGMMGIYSTETSSADSDFLNFKKQLVFFGIGILLMVFFSILDYRYLKTYNLVIYGLGIFILVMVLVSGIVIGGTQGWLLLFGDQGFQPVEVAKIVMIVVLAGFFTNWRVEVQKLRNLIIIFLVAGTLVVLVFMQPDFGSAFILLAIFLGLLFMTKIKKSYVITIVLLFSVLFIAAWSFAFTDIQKDRILTFLDPDRDPWGSGYNIKQSIIAVGSGQFFGRGLSLGPQSGLNFLPVQETDFIFAVIAEELGFVGAILLLGFIVLLIYRLFRISRLARDDFGLLVVGGIIIYLFAQSILNIGMNIGVMPIAGVPLPLVSYGGSSLIATFIMLGIAQSIYIRKEKTVV